MKVVIPTNCPICNSVLERVNSQLFCRNDSCEGRVVNRISSFCKKMKIKGLAIKSIEKLDLLSISELYTLDKDYLVSVLGKNGEKIYKEIQESLNTDIGTLIGSLGIPLIGQTTARKLKATSIEDIDFSGLPNKAKDNFREFANSELYDELCNIPFNLLPAEEVAVTGKTVCLTGKFQFPKAKIEEQLKSLGYKVVQSVTKALDILVTNDINSTSSKIDTAKKYEIQIKTLEEILNGQR